jgi:hypothetical protein
MLSWVCCQLSWTEKLLLVKEWPKDEESVDEKLPGWVMLYSTESIGIDPVSFHALT